MSAIVRHSSDSLNRVPLAPPSAQSLGSKLSETDHTRALRTPTLNTDRQKDDGSSVPLEPHWAAAIDVATD
jgi:hypothetical protein